jgi:hypothetical protein
MAKILTERHHTCVAKIDEQNICHAEFSNLDSGLSAMAAEEENVCCCV